MIWNKIWIFVLLNLKKIRKRTINWKKMKWKFKLKRPQLFPKSIKKKKIWSSNWNKPKIKWTPTSKTAQVCNFIFDHLYQIFEYQILYVHVFRRFALSTALTSVASKIITFYPEVVAQIWLDPVRGFWGCWEFFFKYFFH